MKTSVMKIGFIGSHPLNGRFVQSGKTQYGISGIFPGSSATETNHRVFSSAESLLSVSDVLFIARDAASPYEIGKLAVKEARHLFIETPFSLETPQLDELFALSGESRSIICLNQPLPHHPLYEYYRSSFYPAKVVIRVDSAQRYRSPEAMQDLWFELSALLCDVIPSGVRRSSVHLVNGMQDELIPATYEVRLDFDNGAQALVLVNHHTEAESFEVEFFQEDGRYDMDLYSGEARHFKASTRRTSRLKRTVPAWQDLTIKALQHWLASVMDNRIPLTINEQGQAVHQLTRELLHNIHSKKQLFA
ncbi:MAG: hypothetical protein KGY60_02785 [Bacteroidales bacterium]|nr:hypothetical protein [Bacteroidales bacterium]